MRGRGLKLLELFNYDPDQDVALHAGAWIETLLSSITVSFFMVALHAGAWIETLMEGKDSRAFSVALHAGAWIETYQRL